MWQSGKLHNTDDDKNCCSTAEGLMQHYHGVLRVWVEVIIFTVPLCVSPLLTHTGGFHQWDSSDCRHTSHQMESCVSGKPPKLYLCGSRPIELVFPELCYKKGSAPTTLKQYWCIKTRLKKFTSASGRVKWPTIDCNTAIQWSDQIFETVIYINFVNSINTYLVVVINSNLTKLMCTYIFIFTHQDRSVNTAVVKYMSDNVTIRKKQWSNHYFLLRVVRLSWIKNNIREQEGTETTQIFTDTTLTSFLQINRVIKMKLGRSP